MSETSEQALSYEYLHHILVPLGALNSPAQLHGLIVGQMTGGARVDDEQWLEEALEFLDLADKPDSQTCDAIIRLKNETLVSLGKDFDFQLKIPDDEADFTLRAQAVAEWCYGFLTGFGKSGISGDDSLSPEVSETLRDIAAIAQMDAVEELEADESSLFELAEYVRLGSISMFMEFNVDISMAEQGIAPDASDSPDSDEPIVH